MYHAIGDNPLESAERDTSYNCIKDARRDNRESIDTCFAPKQKGTDHCCGNETEHQRGTHQYNPAIHRPVDCYGDNCHKKQRNDCSKTGHVANGLRHRRLTRPHTQLTQSPINIRYSAHTTARQHMVHEVQFH